MERLHVDVFTQDLLNGVDVKLRLMPSKDALALMRVVAFVSPSYWRRPTGRLRTRYASLIRARKSTKPVYTHKTTGENDGVQSEETSAKGTDVS